MSQQKAQLINATENVTIPGGLDISGVTTAGNFIGSFSGTATGLSGTPNLNVGIVTATLYGDGSNLTGAGSSAFIGVVTAAQSGTTTIDLSLGNTIYFTQDTDTTVAFANTEAVQKLKFIRVKDDTTDERTITWPDSIIWNGGSAPTLISSASTNAQIFNLTTRDQGVTWYGYETMQKTTIQVVFGPSAMWIAGNNGNGTLGQNNPNTSHRSSPVQIPGTQWTQLSQANTAYNYMAIKDDGTLWAWGNNTHGSLGQNNTAAYSSPTQVPGTEWKGSGDTERPSNAGASNLAVAILKTDGTLWVWGRNSSYGQGGLNDLIPRSSPVQIPGTWSQIRPDRHNVYGIKTDGTLWTWGQGTWGALGNNLNVNHSSPIQIPGTQWSRVSSSNYSPFATKTDGTLWAWGYNGSGQLCTNDTANRSSPYQIPGTDWAVNPGGYYMFAATKSDGTLWMAGQNSYGNCGLNDASPRSSPQQIPGTQWSMTAGGYGQQGGIKTDGTLWMWGYNANGSVGHNDRVSYSSPKQIPGTQWTDIGGSEAVTVWLKST